MELTLSINLLNQVLTHPNLQQTAKVLYASYWSECNSIKSNILPSSSTNINLLNLNIAQRQHFESKKILRELGFIYLIDSNDYIIHPSHPTTSPRTYHGHRIVLKAG